MSTYIDILRAHQKGKLGAKEPSAPEPVPADESPERMLREEGSSPPMTEQIAAPMPGDAPLDLEKVRDESPDAMLREEADTAARLLADGVDTGSSDEALSEERDNPSLDIDAANETATGDLLQEETGEAPQDFSDMDDALFAQMLTDEPEAAAVPAEPNDAERNGVDALLADETPEVATENTGAVAAENSIHTWLSGCVMLLVKLCEDAARDTPTDTSPLSQHLARFSAKVYEDPEELGALELDIANRIESIRESHADCGDLVQKAVMMTLYGFKICMQMHMEPAEITRYVSAAILHNIGMAQIFVDTRLKEGTLTNAERTLIRRVPEKSVDYLKRCGITDRVILLAAQQSQERHDGSGPHGLAGADIALSARIVGLLSMFEALVHVRSYRERLLPRDAIRELVNNHKGQFEPGILKNLIESVSLYPVGTYVQLNSGDIGQVVRVQPRLPLRPKIVLTMDRHGNRIQPREVDLHKQPNLMVQRCMYREGLVPMKPEEGKEEKGDETS